ncbi:MAG: threonylcarbamoyl-AMP synthase [Parcubacteria group bacterium]|nr:MAG: threonylcarbamoyl-AMP synthase [Parcubacteria group bacterium]
MRELKLNDKNYVTVLQSALEILRQGGTIIFPTETCYGLGADYYDATAVGKIYQIKKREAGKPLSVLVPDLVAANYLCELSPQARSLAMQYWPGPLTLVLPFKHQHWQKHFSKLLALRVSSDHFANSLTLNLGRPLVATSANLSGQGDIYKSREISKQFQHQKYQPDLFINAGDLLRRRPTTIIKCTERGLEILRQGELKVTI